MTGSRPAPPADTPAQIAPPERPAPEPTVPDAEDATPWLRLDRRMLLIYPVKEAMRFLPLLVLSLAIGTAAGSYRGLLVFTLVLPIAAARYWTTKYRVGPVHVELRQGLLHRRVMSVPLARVRSVEVDADALHRVLGLAELRIGTGHRVSTKDRSKAGFRLDGLARAHAQSLRVDVLAAAHGRSPNTALAAPSPESEPTPDGGRLEAEIGHWSPRWARFAPFSLLGVVTLAAVAGAATPMVRRLLGPDAPEEVYRWLNAASGAQLAWLALAAAGAMLTVSSVLAVLGYLVAFARYRLVDSGPVLNVDSGLIKHTQRSYDRTRLRGGSLQEPLLLRLVGGAKAEAIMTGIRSRRVGAAILLPHSPAREARRVLHRALPTLDPEIALRRHGRAASWRRLTRAVGPVAVVATAQLVAHLAVPGWPAWPWALVAAATVAMTLIALDRMRSLGHAAPDGWLVVRSGSLDRSQDHIAAEGIIGWTVRQTYFQRRAGLADVIAATPAGRGKYVVVDIPIALAWALVERVTPGAGDVWVRRPEQSESIMGE